MTNETKEYGTWKDGSSVYKDKKGFYIYAISYEKNEKGEEYKKYLHLFSFKTPISNFILRDFFLNKTLCWSEDNLRIFHY